MISSMVHAAEPIALAEIQNNVKVIIGNEPRDVFGVGAWALLRRPEVLERVLKDPAAWKRVFEETARWISPIGMYPRQLTRDYEIAGVTLPAGSRVALVIASGNRDESVFERPTSSISTARTAPTWPSAADRTSAWARGSRATRSAPSPGPWSSAA
ncbi:cytochrome P450 [Streptomyces sp. MB09-02B]|uniref:cytochrome P450 n=1 Tax=Streptomyces sp. MB09-02B TaxID=3028667 RepID=UPI0029A6768E|nr:cytochrome P450 [Streptomyces sp. MB09-02B]MDX3644036.1 cytochrome P450 [Streptomyces sp. MB09-02B]